MRGRYIECDPIIYPRKLFVITGPEKFVDEHFSNRDGSKIDVDYDDANAWVHKVVCKDNDNYGIAIWYDSGVTPGSLCHEVMHAVNAYIHDLGTRVPDYDADNYEEFTCYLGGWMYDCVWKFKTGKK